MRKYRFLPVDKYLKSIDFYTEFVVDKTSLTKIVYQNGKHTIFDDIPLECFITEAIKYSMVCYSMEEFDDDTSKGKCKNIGDGRLEHFV